ncbi:MAG: hypothetical protein Q9168_003923 [Polycauliona sp. 1 TL-2023]
MSQGTAAPTYMEGNTNTSLLRRLSAAVNGEAATATFACGGSVDCPSKDGTTKGAVIRWDTDRDPRKIYFPCSQDSTQSFEALVRDCQPATFGLDNRDVLDETYRKAGKLDNTAFSTNFHPHDYGIVDAVQQILMPLPTIGEALAQEHEDQTPRGRFRVVPDDRIRGTRRKHDDNDPHGVRAELYKLNHSGQYVDFDWAGAEPKSIQWAAFYGDCEHEILQVTSGHRVTLTYNLYYAALADWSSPICDPTKLPLFDTVAQMLREPKFMRFGGRLGFFCQHAYAHSTEAGRKLIPGAFKGVDLAVFSAFVGLGLEVDVNPILHKEEGWNDIEFGWGGLPAKELMGGSRPDGNETDDFVEAYLNEVDRTQREAMVVDVDENDSYYEREERSDFLKEAMTIVGSEMHGPMFDSTEDEELESKASGGTPYGNQAELAYKFSAAAILVSVSSSRARGLRVPTTANPVRVEPEPTTTLPVYPPVEASNIVDLTEDEEIAKPILGWWAEQR